MPSKQKKVRFETEYNSSFKAFDIDVYKSPLIDTLLPKATIENVAIVDKAAGLESQKFLIPNEPPLQHKRTNVEDLDSNVTKGKHQIKATNTKTNKALKFKAGLKPVATQTEPRKHPVSEYQKEFEWKKNVANDSPLLNAEKVVFDSHTNIPRFVPGKVTHKTEYQSKFDTQKDKLRKKEEKEEILEDRVDEQELPSSTVKRFLQTSQNPDVPFFPHGSNRIYHSEYQSNFGSPKNYKYKEGIWLGAKPPHLLPDEDTPRSLNQPITNWFEEVLELREKARQYKSRAIEGNYFSREFLEKLDEELEQIDLEQDRSKNQNSDNKCSPVKYAWGRCAKNDKSTSTDGLGKSAYRERSENGSDSSDDTSSSTEDDKNGNQPTRVFVHGQSGIPNDKRNIGKTYAAFKPMLSKTDQYKSSNVGGSPELDQTHEATSGSEASSEDSDNNNSVNFTPKTTRSKNNFTTHEKNCDKFDINRIPRIKSNDDGVLGSLGSSVQSLDGSNSGSYTKKYPDSDCSSVSSYLSSQSIARETLSRASKRNTEFWKKRDGG